MAIPADWSIRYNWHPQLGLQGASDVRMICPYCRNASTFNVRSIQNDLQAGRYIIYLLIQCNYSTCRKNTFIKTSVQSQAPMNSRNDEFYMHPSREIDLPHPAIPPAISEDWAETQRAMQASAPKAAAMMLRRVMYGVLLDKGCKEHPLHEGMKELIDEQRLPAIFDQWLPAIRDDGHDAAHPHRALQVSTDNISESMSYTAELLRYVYIEPYEFQQRLNRNAQSPKP